MQARVYGSCLCPPAEAALTDIIYVIPPRSRKGVGVSGGPGLIFGEPIPLYLNKECAMKQKGSAFLKFFTKNLLRPAPAHRPSAPAFSRSIPGTLPRPDQAL